MDLPGLEAIVNDLHIATGLDAALIDGSFRVLVRRHSGLNFCTLLHASPRCLEQCVASDNAQTALVARTGRSVCYTCPFGLFEAIAPIRRKGQVIAYLFLSVGIQEGPEDRLLPVRKARAVAPELSAQALEKALEKVPCCSGQRLRAYGSLLSMAAEVIENNDLLADPGQSLGQLAKNYIKNNLDQKITLAELSYRLGCSTVTLTSRFKAEFGLTVMEYVTGKRMNLARQLLLEDNFSVAQVAERCGFPDPAYFSKCFKQSQGLSPMEWKKRERNMRETGSQQP